MTEQQYIRIRLSQVPAHLEEEITLYCFQGGASGVSESLIYTQPDLTYDPRIVPTQNHDLDVFFEKEPSTEFFNGLRDLSPYTQWHIFTEENKDWLEEWKKGFNAFKLVGPYWVVPSWLEKPAECEQPIYIDPGMAFGTGTHATTQMMAALLYKLSEQYKTEINNWSVLDVGTGTAILAMLAQKAGFGLVSGIEIDPEARRVARDNVKLNKLEEIDVPDSQLDELKGPYEVVVANIIDGVLIKIKRDLLRVLKPGGHMLLTGILEERDNHFFENFLENTDLKVVRRLQKDEWVGYWVQSKSDA